MKEAIKTSPFLQTKKKISTMMLHMIFALLPALTAGILRYGIRAAGSTLVCVLAAVLTEYVFGKLIIKKDTIRDASAVVTGMLFALILPPQIPYLIAVCGSMFAILAGKIWSGGIGRNVFNPALAGRAFLVLVAPGVMVSFPDTVSGATPIHGMQIPQLPEAGLWDMFLGRIDGCMGEISSFAILMGAAYLLFQRVISFEIPLTYLGTIALLTYCFPKGEDAFLWMMYSLLGGGVMFGAFFMATDPVTSPVTKAGKWIYGAGCGALTVLFRYYGLFPEGVTYAILIMNAASCVIDRYTPPRRFGSRGGKNK